MDLTPQSAHLAQSVDGRDSPRVRNGKRTAEGRVLKEVSWKVA